MNILHIIVKKKIVLSNEGHSWIILMVGWITYENTNDIIRQVRNWNIWWLNMATNSSSWLYVAPYWKNIKSIKFTMKFCVWYEIKKRIKVRLNCAEKITLKHATAYITEQYSHGPVCFMSAVISHKEMKSSIAPFTITFSFSSYFWASLINAPELWSTSRKHL